MFVGVLGLSYLDFGLQGRGVSASFGDVAICPRCRAGGAGLGFRV